MVKNQNPPGNAAAIFWRCQDNAQFNIHINHTFIGAAKSPKPNQKFKTLIEKETKKNLGNFCDKSIKSISAHRGLQMGLLFFDRYHTLLNLARLITCFHYYTYTLTVCHLRKLGRRFIHMVIWWWLWQKLRRYAVSSPHIWLKSSF